MCGCWRKGEGEEREGLSWVEARARRLFGGLEVTLNGLADLLLQLILVTVVGSGSAIVVRHALAVLLAGFCNRCLKVNWTKNKDGH